MGLTTFKVEYTAIPVSRELAQAMVDCLWYVENAAAEICIPHPNDEQGIGEALEVLPIEVQEEFKQLVEKHGDTTLVIC